MPLRARGASIHNKNARHAFTIERESHTGGKFTESIACVTEALVNFDESRCSWEMGLRAFRLGRSLPSASRRSSETYVVGGLRS